MPNADDVHRVPDRWPVVAGIDGSVESLAAARLAADRARQLGLPLRLVHAYTAPLIWPPLSGDHDPHDALPRAHARHLAGKAANWLRDEYPDLAVDADVVDGHAAKVLVECSREAELLVVGHRGSGGFNQLLAGSVAQHTATHAHCPVVVVRGGPAKPDAPVVVGLDGSPGAHRTAQFAFDVALRRGAPLLAVSVWPADQPWPEAVAVAGYPRPQVSDPITASIGDLPELHRDVVLHRSLVRAGSPTDALIQAAEGAGLIVVGSRGLNRLTGLLLGSVGRALIDHAPCPVAIVRPPSPTH